MKKDFTKKDFHDLLEPNGDCLEWTGLTRNGYGNTWAWGKMRRTHRLALELEGISTEGHLVLHSCDNPCCCNPAHLRLGNHQDNMDDMISRGRQNSLRGSTNGSAKLTEHDVLEIRAIRGMSQRAIADQYGVDQSAISLIRNRKKWKHI